MCNDNIIEILRNVLTELDDKKVEDSTQFLTIDAYSCENCHLFLLKVYQLSIIHFLLFYFKQSGNFMSINFIVSPIK